MVHNGRSLNELKHVKRQKGSIIKRRYQTTIKMRLLYFLKDVAEIMYLCPRYTNVDGIIAHGAIKLGERLHFVSCQSPKAKLFVENNLRVEVLIAKIMSTHVQLVLELKRKGIGPNQDIKKEADIRNIAENIDHELFRKHANDVESVQL